jgi:hypothetical protein
VWPEEGAPGQILEGDDRESLLLRALSLVRPSGLILERRPTELVRVYPDPWPHRTREHSSEEPPEPI